MALRFICGIYKPAQDTFVKKISPKGDNFSQIFSKFSKF